MPGGELRQGQIFWVDDVPPLEGEHAKRRPVIVVSPTRVLRAGADRIDVMAISTSAMGPERIPIPSLADDPRATSRLPRRSWAVPRWTMQTRRSRLGDRCGYISGALLARVIAAYEGATRPTDA